MIEVMNYECLGLQNKNILPDISKLIRGKVYKINPITLYIIYDGSLLINELHSTCNSIAESYHED